MRPQVLSAGCWVLSGVAQEQSGPAIRKDSRFRRRLSPFSGPDRQTSSSRTKETKDGSGGTQHSALSTQHIAILILLLALAPAALACPVCFGAPGDPMVKGVNNGIWVLLGLVAFVQIGFGALFFSFWRRGRAQRKFRDSLTVIDGGAHH